MDTKRVTEAVQRISQAAYCAHEDACRSRALDSLLSARAQVDSRAGPARRPCNRGRLLAEPADNSSKKRFLVCRHQGSSSRKQTVMVRTTTLPLVERLPETATYVPVLRNFREEDDSKLRFVPYFGEQDDLVIDTASYDLSLDEEILEEDEAQLLAVFDALGTDTEVSDALGHILHLAPESLVTRYHELRGTIAQKDARDKRKLEHLGYDVDPVTLLDSYEKLYCRRCSVYDCRMHGYDQPRKYGRRLPSDALLQLDFAKELSKFNPVARPSTACGQHCYSILQCHCVMDITVYTQTLCRKMALVLNYDLCKTAQLLQVECCQVWRACGSLQSTTYEAPGIPDTQHKVSRARIRSLKLGGEAVPATQFTPCEHAGPCGDPGTCRCTRTETFCSKLCGCDTSQCKNMFRGCACQGCKCMTKACPCFASGRECDPDLCRVCKSYTPDTDTERLCRNTSIQCLHRHALVVAESKVHGFGAFSRDPVTKGELVTEYVGETISQDEADRRGRVYDKINRSYLFDLNADLVIDAARKGNKMRFANHSEDPNCFSKVMRVNGDHRIGVYAKRDIRAGEEILFHYNHAASSQNETPHWFKKNRL